MIILAHNAGIIIVNVQINYALSYALFEADCTIGIVIIARVSVLGETPFLIRDKEQPSLQAVQFLSSLSYLNTITDASYREIVNRPSMTQHQVTLCEIPKSPSLQRRHSCHSDQVTVALSIGSDFVCFPSCRKKS